MKKLTLEEFITNFSNRFPNKNYNFDESIYVDSHTKMKVKCKHDHIFYIRPCDLINGYGCPVCGGTKKLTKEEFIELSKSVHNNYFSYEHCDFTDVSSQVTVTCPIHGDISVKANNHLNGANCKLCSLDGFTHKITLRQKKNNSTKKLTTEQFKKKLKEKWGDKYVCDKNAEYIKSNIPIKIVCKEHGVFNITPNHILSGRGCPICGKNKKKTKEEIIQEIKNTQPYSDYDFDKVIYTGIHNNITLKCNKCGTIFSNSPSNLIKYKNGCPGCNSSSLENEIKFLLEKHCILYERQKTFEWLKYKNNLKLDFYLPDYNIAIECQGIQHFKETNFGSNISSLDENLNRDKIKYELCKIHNIKILYYANYHIDFPYYVYEDKNVLINDIKFNEI